MSTIRRLVEKPNILRKGEIEKDMPLPHLPLIKGFVPGKNTICKVCNYNDGTFSLCKRGEKDQKLCESCLKKYHLNINASRGGLKPVYLLRAKL